MAYNNTPQANQRISDTQPLIQSNFTQIQTAFSVNHVAIADGSGNQGKHNFVTFPKQVAAPVSAATEVALFNAISALTSTTELWVNNVDAGISIPMTASNYLDWAYLPSGILMKWFTATALVPGINIVTIPSSASNPAFTRLLTVMLTPIGTSDHTVFFRGIETANSFSLTVNGSGSTTQCLYLAIGF